MCRGSKAHHAKRFDSKNRETSLLKSVTAADAAYLVSSFTCTQRLSLLEVALSAGFKVASSEPRNGRYLFATNTRNCAQAIAGPCLPGRRASRVTGGDRINQSACREGSVPQLVLRHPWSLVNAISQFPYGPFRPFKQLWCSTGSRLPTLVKPSLGQRECSGRNIKYCHVSNVQAN